MRNLRVILIVICVVFGRQPAARAWEWVPLHEKADELNSEQAEAYAKEEPDSLERQYVLALVYLYNYEADKAGEIFERILKEAPQAVEAAWGRAEVLRRKHKNKESKQLLDELIKKAPQFWPAYISLSYLEYTQKNFKKALELAVKVTHQGREAVDLSNYARAYSLVGGIKGMLAYYGGPVSKMVHGFSIFPYLEKAHKLQPDAPAVLFGLGSFYFLSPKIIGGDQKKAEEYLLKAIEADAKFADAYVRIAQLYKMQGDDEKYRFYIGRAQELDPDNTLLLDFLEGRCEFICVSIKE